MESIAIIGGGPAGAIAAERLLSGSKGSHPIRNVMILEERPGWEKPCGGGLTAKAVRRYPFLIEACERHTRIEEAELVAANAASVRFHLRTPLLIYSRSVLNNFLLKRALSAGACVINDHIAGFEREGGRWRLRGRCDTYFADYLILAAGARTGLRKALVPPLEAQDFMLTFGYFAPSAGSLLRVQFFKNFEGYAWAFPRPDHTSLGIAGQIGESDMAGLQSRLHEFMNNFGYSGKQSPVFAHLLPALGPDSWRKLVLSGDAWVIAGDAAGLADPLTGEGIYFAMRSGELAADAILQGSLERYPQAIWQEFGSRHAIGAHLARRFYHDDFWGKPMTTRMVEFCSRSPAFMDLLQDLFEGTQAYAGLPQRVYRTFSKRTIEVTCGSVKKALSAISNKPSAASHQ